MQNQILHMIFPENFEEKIEFDNLRKLLKQHCLSSLGKSRVDEISMSNRIEQIKINLNLTDEFLQIINSDKEFPVQHFFDLRGALDKIEIEGAFLELQELFDLKRALEEIKAIISFFKNTVPINHAFLNCCKRRFFPVIQYFSRTIYSSLFIIKKPHAIPSENNILNT